MESEQRKRKGRLSNYFLHIKDADFKASQWAVDAARKGRAGLQDCQREQSRWVFLYEI